MPYPLSTTIASLLAVSSLWAQSSFRITTVAGSNFVGDGGTAVAATLSAVEGLASDATGNLYIVDNTDHRIRRVDRQGRISTVAGNGSAGFRGDGGPAVEAILSAPYGLAADSTGNLFVADFGNRRVRRIGIDGLIRTVAGGGTSRTPGEGGDALGVQFLGPRNVAVDAVGNLYVSDYLDHRIYRIGVEGGVSVVAGTGVAGLNGDGAGVSTQLNYPAGLAVDRSGAVYVADSGNKLIRRIAGGQVTTVLGGPGSAVSFGAPLGLAMDREGNLYIADGSANRLYRRAVNGGVSTVAGANPALNAAVRDVTVDALGGVCFASGKQVMKLVAGGASVAIAGSGAEFAIVENADARRTALQGPMGLAVDTSGNLYIAEERLGRVRRVSAGGLIQTIAGGGQPTGSSVGDGGPATQAKLVDPVAVAWDAVAGLRIVDYQGNRVRGLLSSGAIYTVAGDGEPGYRGDSSPASQSRLNRPRAAAFDREGNLYVADSLNHRIRRIGANGFISTVAGSGVRGFFGDGGPAAQAQFNAPQGVAVDAAGNLYIADTGNQVVRRVSPEGILSTVAGTGIRGYSGDGAAAALSALNSPIAVAVDAEGRLLIADTFNHRVRRVSAAGLIETIAGDGTPGYSGDDGPSRAAQLNAPAGLAVDAAGYIYVADLDNNRVRLLTPSAEFSVLPPADASADSDLTVMNAASLRTGPISPGMMVALFGTGLGPERAAQAELSGGRLPFTLGGAEVRIDGKPAAMFYAGAGQINAEVPRGLKAGAVMVEALRGGKTVAAARVEARPAQPALFTMGNGVGQAVVVNEDGSLNSEERPAARGSIVSLFGTGEGETGPAGLDGVPSGTPPPQPLLPLQVQVGTAGGEVLFAGRAPGFVGLLQVNVKLPGIFTPPGVRTLTLIVGGVSSQPGVTIAVK